MAERDLTEEFMDCYQFGRVKMAEPSLSELAAGFSDCLCRFNDECPDGCRVAAALRSAEEEIKRLRRMIEAYDAAAALERGVGINMHDVMVTAQKETMTKLIAAEAVLADMRQTAETMRAFIQRTALLSHPIGRDAGQFLDALDSLTPPEHSPKDAPPQAPSAPSPDSAQE